MPAKKKGTPKRAPTRKRRKPDVDAGVKTD